MLVSDERKLYLKRIKLERFYINLFRWLILFIFIIGWELLSKFELINTFIFSSPSLVIKTLISLINGGVLFKHISITIYEILISFGLATLIGFIISTAMWFVPFFAKVLDPYLTIINSLPKVALGPLIIIWVGASTSSIIFMSLLISAFITIINLYSSFISTNRDYITLMKCFRANKIKTFCMVVLPSNRNNIINTFKINISMSLIGVIMGELLVSKSGIGYLIMYGSQVFNINLVITGVLMLGIISYMMYFIIDKFEQKK